MGVETGAMNGTVVIMTRAPYYGLKMNTKAWRVFFVPLKEMEIWSVNLDIYIKRECNKKRCKYWSYNMLVYIDDCLLVHHELDLMMEDLKQDTSSKRTLLEPLIDI